MAWPPSPQEVPGQSAREGCGNKLEGLLLEGTYHGEKTVQSGGAQQGRCAGLLLVVLQNDPLSQLLNVVLLKRRDGGCVTDASPPVVPHVKHVLVPGSKSISSRVPSKSCQSQVVRTLGPHLHMLAARKSFREPVPAL